MRQTASAIIFGGAAFLVAWLVSPAASAPTALVQPPAFLVDEVALADLDAQVARLSDRLSQPSDYPEPVRDPFRFGRSTDRPEPAAPSSVDVRSASPAPMLLPKLVAILAVPAEGLAQRSAVLEEGDSVRIASTGEHVGALTIAAITDEGVTLIDPANGAIVQLRLH
jgi:hypothetical protein